MTTAEQARKIATLYKMKNRTINKELKNINKYIKKAARKGEMSILYITTFVAYKTDIKKILQEFGYNVQDSSLFRGIEIEWR